MQSNKLFIFVEGYDDKIFFEKIILPRLKERYVSISIRMYASEKKPEMITFVHNLKQANFDYIFVVDKNSERICITAKKQNIHKTYEVDTEKIIVVTKEIESWYLAGLSEDNSHKLGLPVLENTDNIGKKRFEEYVRNIRKHSTYRTAPKPKSLLNDILTVFSIKTAKQKNASFKYFTDKYQL